MWNFLRKYIFQLFTDIQSIFGGAKINLNSCGDSTPRYAIYQLNSTLKYTKIGTWNQDNGTSSLKLNPNVIIPLLVRREEGVLDDSTQCLPTCVNPDKPITFQMVRKQNDVYYQINYDLLLLY